MGLITSIQRQLQRILPRWTVGEDLRAQQHSLIRILATAHAKKLDLNRLIGNLAKDSPDAYGTRLESLRRWIAAESSVPVALAQTPGALNEDDTLAIQCGTELETLDATFAFLRRQHERQSLELDRQLVDEKTLLFSMMSYVAIVFSFVALVLTFFMLRIIPGLVAIFDDFEMQLPYATSSLADFFGRSWLYAIAFLLAVITFAVAIQFEDVQQIFAKSWLGRRLTFAKRRNAGGILRLLAIASNGGRSAEQAVTAAAQYHPDRRFRHTLLAIRTEAANEKELWDELRRHKILSEDEAAQLVSLSDPSLRSWGLEYLSNQRFETVRRRSGLLIRLIQYVPIAFLCLLVGWIVVAVMQTLTSMVTALT